MKKVIIEFSDDEYLEKTEVNAAIHATDLALCILYIEELARKSFEYDNDIEPQAIFDIIYEKIGSINQYVS